ncbi:RNA polymerase sigma factor [Roseibacillus persicicus]|uniref:RNA polymerase sigma factor n=1 Tax=Roseibacillus persicicus TaxID=454148 RepID=A0A918TCK1_9BACT|nr:sigma-70 family RNA polymerase sigma factor [Roseibacillus persicicus]MDQ8192481.1 sigma-70 family RNA polymerase sigma factor [Roseibacillus persicicus]GHC41338.1 RNA polymerase sigma factor SigX [Roseibacillus persicicus]
MVKLKSVPEPIEPSPDLADLDDATLVARCQAELPSDLTAYRELVRRYEGLIFNTCRRVIGSPEDAEEVTQDTLLQIFHKIHQFQGRSSFKTWLYKIVHNYCRNRISKLARKREGQNAYEEHAANDEDDREADNRNAALSQAVEEALAKLKKPEREVIVLKFMTGLTLQETADVLGVKLSAAKMRLYRALESFKEAYSRLDNAPPLPTFQHSDD